MSFSVGLSSDLSDGSGGFSWGKISIETLDPLPWKFMPETGSTFTPDALSGFDAIAFAAPGVTSESFGKPEDSPIVISRFGVGYDTIDLAACTRAGTALTITPDGSQKPVATAALTLLLSLMHRLVTKDHLAHKHAWGRRMEGLGLGLNGKTVGTIGLGNVATEFFRLLSPFDCARLSFDPWKKQDEADAHSVQLVDIDSLMKRCDVVIVMAVLTPDTQHLIDAEKISLMKKTALLINVSRGPIIDELALISALRDGVIAGAALDVFEQEPPAKDNPLFSMNNVILTPHNIAWTDELAFGMGKSAFTAIKSVSQGAIPKFVVNKEVLDSPAFNRKLKRCLS